jgi:hypothetical protein
MAEPILDLDYRLEESGLQELFADLERFGKKTVPQLVLERSVLLARYLAENTQPVAAGNGGAITNDNTLQGKLDGGSLTARNLGRAAVRRDLRRVYASPSGAFEQLRGRGAVSGDGEKMARAFYRALKRGDLAEAKQILIRAGVPSGQLDIIPWDDGARHKRLRNKRGRVNRSNKPQVVSDAKKLKAYFKHEEDQVGFTKACWINAARQLGNVRGMGQVRQWIKKHTSAPGRGVNGTRVEDHPRVVLSSLVAWASEALSPAQFSRALSQLDNSMRVELQKILDHLAAKDAQRTRSAGSGRRVTQRA